MLAVGDQLGGLGVEAPVEVERIADRCRVAMLTEFTAAHRPRAADLKVWENSQIIGPMAV